MQIRDRLPVLLVFLAAVLAVLPLLLHGCSCGHDFTFHLLNWQEAARQFRHGNLHPRWAFTAAFGAGEPRFVFYPPLSWTLGGLLTLAVAAVAALFRIPGEIAFAAVPVLFTWLALTAAGLGMFRLARRFLARGPATLAATLYLANPYTLFTAFERTAFAELLAAALLPLLLLALLPHDQRDHAPDTAAPSLPTLAIPLALLWLTNAPAAVIGSYAVAFFLLLRLAQHLRARRVAQARALAFYAVAGSALALGLAAFYIGPVLLERPWVQISMAVLPGLRPEDNTLFHHTADSPHDAVLHTASLLAVLLLCSTLLALLLAIFRPGPFARLPARHATAHPSSLPLFLLGLTVTVAVLLTPVSLPLWHHLPEFTFLQFPWRLLALLAPVFALALCRLLPPSPRRRVVLPALSLLLPAALAFASFHLFQQPCDAEDRPAARFLLFRSPTGEEPTDEYTPVTADNDSLKDNNPPFRVLPLSVDDDTPPPDTAVPGLAPLALTVSLTAPARVVFNLRDYPAWQVRLNGQLTSSRDHRADGLLTLALPAGQTSIQLEQHTPLAEYLADLVSVLCLALTLALLVRARRHRRSLPSGAARTL